MKEKIKNFLLKIKNVFNEKHSFRLIELIVICILINLITLTLSYYEIMSYDYCFNETHTEQVEEMPQAESFIIDRDIKGANPTVSDYVNPSVTYSYIYFNCYNPFIFWDSFYNVYNYGGFLDLGTGNLIYPIYAESSGSFYQVLMVLYDNVTVQGSQIFSLCCFEVANDFSSYQVLYILGHGLYSNGTYSESTPISNVYYTLGTSAYSSLDFGSLGVVPIGSYNESLFNAVSSISFESDSSIVDTSSLTLNETNFDGSVHFSTFLTKETIAGYFSQLTYETTNFITPSLTLSDVDSYTIITGRIGSVPIANYIPSLVIVKYESKYVVYNYLRDYYLTPIYDTSTGVLENVLGDGNYFLDVSSPTYFGSENDKFNLFISAINIADSPLYSLISIGYNNGYDFGYGYGYNTGHQVGFADGEESGYNEGYDTGFENGFADGRDTANPLAPVMSLFKDSADVIASVLNVQILPNLTIGTILLFPIVALLFALFVRLFFGG